MEALLNLNAQKITFLTIAIACVLTSCSTGTQTFPTPTPTQEPLHPTETPVRSQVDQDAWNEDLDFFMTRLREIHPNPFYRVSEEEYLQGIEDIKARLSTMTDEQVIVELTRIVAFIDGHSSVNTLGEPVNFQIYPIRLYQFSDGVFIIGAQEPFDDLAGGRVIQIGKASVDEALDAVAPLIPHDNPMGILLGSPSWLMRPEVLLALGLIDSMDNPQIVVEMPDGTQQTIDPSPIPFADYRVWAGGDDFGNGPVFGLPERPEPLYLSRAGSESFWTTYLEDTNTLYIQYNRVRSGINRLTREIQDILDQQDVERVILDLRFNPGGNNTTYAPFLELLTNSPEINRPGHFFTILGRQTFSAAANFATELENQTHTLFVGEPMGGSPNLYGDVRPITLPNSKIQIFISALYWEKSTPEDKRIWIKPDIPAPLSSQDFFNDIDPSMEAILDFDPDEAFILANNPILEPNSSDDWDATDVRDPYVLEVDGIYYMFFAGQDANGTSSIGYAISENGKKWFRQTPNPILTGDGEGFDANGVTAPVVQIEDGVWTLYYGAIENGTRPTSIGRATAENPGGPWVRDEAPLLTVGESPAWDSLSITPGSVIDVDGVKRLYYSGFSAEQVIGVGYAESADGITWTKYNDSETTSVAFTDSDPVLPGGRTGDWDYIVYAPFIHVRDGKWEMFYHGDPLSTGGSNEIGLGIATSTDGIEWTRANEPFLISREEGRFPHTPAAIEVEQFLYIYYALVETGGNSSHIEIAILPK